MNPQIMDRRRPYVARTLPSQRLLALAWERYGHATPDEIYIRAAVLDIHTRAAEIDGDWTPETAWSRAERELRRREALAWVEKTIKILE